MLDFSVLPFIVLVSDGQNIIGAVVMLVFLKHLLLF